MATRFAVKKSSSFGYLLLIAGFLIAFSAIGLPILTKHPASTPGFILSIAITVTFVGFFLWTWLDTCYLIDKDILIAKSGPLIWKVPIKEISFVRLNQKTIGGTWKPTLSWNCIEIRYKKIKSVFISPEKQDDFIARLKGINDKIEIK